MLYIAGALLIFFGILLAGRGGSEDDSMSIFLGIILAAAGAYMMVYEL